MSSTDVRLERPAHLSDAQYAAVQSLLRAATDCDGVSPLSEHVVLHLRHSADDGVRHCLAWSGDDLLGYGHLDMRTDTAETTAELVVSPEARRRGIGRAIVVEFLAAAPRLRLWAHGRQSGADELAQSLGFEQVRELRQMRRSLLAPLPRADVPAGVVLRPFDEERDSLRWVEVNSRAFAHLPDQGRMTIDDLRMRLRQTWFDPAGFLVAEQSGDLIGFHWTKIHDARAHDLLGEVYMVAVDPLVTVPGLGTALVTAGLAHLRSRGLTQVMLYVDATNERAIRLYERLGFTHWDSDVQYSATT